MDKALKWVVFGPGPIFKGGIANFTVSLCNAIKQRFPLAQVHLVSWTQQYPSIIPREFKDQVSAEHFLNENVQVKYLTNFNRPSTWRKTAEYISGLQPDVVLLQWALAIQGIPIGQLAKGIRKRSHAKLIFDVHNLVQKESSGLDNWFTRYALSQAEAWIFHGKSTEDEFRQYFPDLAQKGFSNHGILSLFHPIYEVFSPRSDFDKAAAKEALGLRAHVFLFFGFIRKYKGLHHALDGFARLCERRKDVSLLIVGENFWKQSPKPSLANRTKAFVFSVLKWLFIRSSDQGQYNPLGVLPTLSKRCSIVHVDGFVPNEQVYRYFQVSDAVVNFYEYATPSGVESIAYNFGLPVLVTPVGHFKEAIVEGKNGYVARDFDPESLADVMEKIILQPISSQSVMAFTQKLSWQAYVEAIYGWIKKNG